MEAKQEKLLVKQYSLQIKEEKARKKEVSWSSNDAVCAAHDTVILHLSFYFILQEKRKRREENLKRRAANERKAEIVQVVRQLIKGSKRWCSSSGRCVYFTCA